MRHNAALKHNAYMIPAKLVLPPMHTFTVDKELSTTAGSDVGRSEQVSSGGGHVLLVDMVSGKSIRPCVPSLPKIKADIKTDGRLPRIRLNRKGKQTTSDPPCLEATCSGERVGVSRNASHNNSHHGIVAIILFSIFIVICSKSLIDQYTLNESC